MAAARRSIRWAAVIMIAAAPLAACSDDGGGEDEAAVEIVLNGIVTDFNEGNGPDFAAAFTDQGLGVFFENPGATREELLGIATEAVGSDELTVRDIADVEITGDSATAEMELSVSDLLLHEQYTLVREDGTWLIDGYESLDEE